VPCNTGAPTETEYWILWAPFKAVEKRLEPVIKITENLLNFGDKPAQRKVITSLELDKWYGGEN